MKAQNTNSLRKGTPHRKKSPTTSSGIASAQLPNHLSARLRKAHDIQVIPSEKLPQVDAQPAFLPLLLLWGLYSSRRKKYRQGMQGGHVPQSGWGGMGSGSPWSQHWFQNPAGNFPGTGGNAPTLPYWNQGMWGPGPGFGGAHPGPGPYAQAPSGPAYPPAGGRFGLPMWF